MSTYEEVLRKITPLQKYLVEYLFEYRNTYVKWLDIVNYVTNFTYHDNTPEYESALNTVRVVLNRLRKKIKQDKLPFKIKTKAKLGLMLEIKIDNDEYCVFCDFYLLKMYDRCSLHSNIQEMGSMKECSTCKHLNRIFINEERLKD